MVEIFLWWHLGHNRGPGRPALAVKALQHQPHTLYSILTEYDVNGESDSLEALPGEEITVESNAVQQPTNIPESGAALLTAGINTEISNLATTSSSLGYYSEESQTSEVIYPFFISQNEFDSLYSNIATRVPAIGENISQDTEQSSISTYVLPKKRWRKPGQKDTKPRKPRAK